MAIQITVKNPNPSGADISRLKRQALAMYQGSNAVVPVALAAIGGTPTHIKAGNVIKLPPPATALSRPARKPAIASIAQSNKAHSSQALI